MCEFKPGTCWECGKPGLIDGGTVGNYKAVCPHCEAESPYIDCPFCGCSTPKAYFSQFRKDFINRKGLIAMIEKQKGDAKTKERMLVIIRTYIPDAGGN